MNNLATIPIRFFLALSVILLFYPAQAEQRPAPWFEKFKQHATPQQLYEFLYLLPKGGDLHHHLNGSSFSEWWFEFATKPQLNGGYRYYTKVLIKQCHGFGNNEFGQSPNYLLFRNIQLSSYEKLSRCEKDEYKALEDLTSIEQEAWLNSIRLDKSYEGRNEFFEKHWRRLNELNKNPHLMAELLVKNMQAFAQEGLLYLESQANASNYITPQGHVYPPAQVVDIFKARLAKQDAIDTGVTTRLQYSLLRFIPNAEQELERIYAFVDQHRDIYVGINMVGREDNDKGYPLRFLATLRKLRQTFPPISMSIHAGEVDEPNFHVRDSLLLGADRIGHGVNLIDDPQTLLLMRHNRYLVEINLISNLLLEYVDEYSQHPFPEYLRTGIPVAISTDDRGMWDSTMTDEFYVAVTEFNLSWQEIISLGNNSLMYSFVDDKTKAILLSTYQQKVSNFVAKFHLEGTKMLADIRSPKRGFICKHYKLCALEK